MTGFGAEELIDCYRRGAFPMAESRWSDGFYLMEPDTRAVFPLDTFKPSRSMEKFRRKTSLTVTINQAFADVIGACATSHPETWISFGIEGLYRDLHDRNLAHSVEVWDQSRLVGGLYGVTQGGAFFGESMFSRATNASKLALIHLIERLRDRRFTLLDAQYMTDHLASLGAIEISRDDYLARLRRAIFIETTFD
ncbi:leucyl/phenylalanyl-tRNA--protein transferase [Algimonas porphyrae]|uniref:Leucyl/phenylalanyl-tRNA--protein transferase n=1 Tax=Algimonas porphyrae TaxID=1128113 RepID=A0ABQ5UWZ0_9PROT|nr:leucyl/phenylalanyl-tRNA--protein transferase [Algimonas porphyrae]GLQ19073.1 leucyl/phenylalanyl-tRNA--protein transferase [Algimonas porphyrae]